MATDYGRNSKTGLHTLGFSYEMEENSLQVEISKDNGELCITLYDHDPELDNNAHKTLYLPVEKREQFAQYLREVADMLSTQ